MAETSVLSDLLTEEFTQIISDAIYSADMRVGGEGNIADAIAHFMADDDLVRANEVIEALSKKAAKMIAIRGLLRAENRTVDLRKEMQHFLDT